MKLYKFLCFIFLLAVFVLTMHKPPPFSKKQPIKSFHQFIQNPVVNRGQKIVLIVVIKFNMNRDVTVFAFEVGRVS